MGRRRLRREQYDSFLEENTLIEEKDDRKEALGVKNSESLNALVKGQNERTGAVGRAIKQRGLVEYGADGKARVNDEAVLKEAANIKSETLGARFYPQSYLDEQPQEIQERYGLGRRAARNIIAGEYQIRAQAILTAATAGKVKIDANTKGILNNYAAGRYEQAIYGNVDERTGKRTYERGRYFSELGFSEAEKFTGAGTSVNTAAARAEKRKDFIENVQAKRFNSFQASPRGLGQTATKRTESIFSSFVSSEPNSSKQDDFIPPPF